jgi:hypothetical protein
MVRSWGTVLKDFGVKARSRSYDNPKPKPKPEPTPTPSLARNFLDINFHGFATRWIHFSMTGNNEDLVDQEPADASLMDSLDESSAPAVIFANTSMTQDFIDEFMSHLHVIGDVPAIHSCTIHCFTNVEF